MTPTPELAATFMIFRVYRDIANAQDRLAARYSASYHPQAFQVDLHLDPSGNLTIYTGMDGDSYGAGFLATTTVTRLASPEDIFEATLDLVDQILQSISATVELLRVDAEVPIYRALSAAWEGLRHSDD